MRRRVRLPASSLEAAETPEIQVVRGDEYQILDTRNRRDLNVDERWRAAGGRESCTFQRMPVGFSLDAAVRVGAHVRAGLERLLRARGSSSVLPRNLPDGQFALIGQSCLQGSGLKRIAMHRLPAVQL